MRLNKLIAALKGQEAKFYDFEPVVCVRQDGRELSILSIYLEDKVLWIDVMPMADRYRVAFDTLMDDLREECPKRLNPKVKWATEYFLPSVKIKSITSGRKLIWIELEGAKLSKRR